ncbi:MAG TPA: hypothetical protein VGR28_03220 [Candidatus Thermoplasmatota archaeon]|jgi:hypothetical protein|nr:hypothetical protein [Candidatus Thermoplasmatota archaeon]
MALDASKANDLGRWFAMVPGFEAAVQRTALTTVDTVVAALRSDEMQGTFETTVRSITAELREEIARKEWKERRPGAAPPAAKSS